MSERATVDRLVDAETGDTVWMYDSQQNRYVDKVYQGRGVWSLRTIEAETRKSFTVWHSKFDRKTGRQMATGGYSGSYSIAGQSEYEASRWMTKNEHRLKLAIENVTDISVLKQIAALVGYEEQTE